MIWKDRILALVLAVAISAAAGAAVLRFAPEKPVFTPGQIDAGITYEATGVASDEIVARVGDNSAPAELLTYQIGYSCSYLDYMLQMYGEEGLDLKGTMPTGENTADYIRAESLELLKQQLVLEKLTAQYDIALSDEAEAELAAQREEYVAELGEDGYLAELYKLGLSEAGYDRVMRANYLYEALYSAYNDPDSAFYPSDDVLHAYAAGAGYITADHILLMTIDQATREPLDDETVAQKRELAEDLLWRLRDSSDPIALFRELADEYSEDPGHQTNPEGYTFTQGTMVESFDAAARALGENEYSDVVESEYGFHIILRRPLDVAEAVEAVRSEYFDVFFLAEVDQAELKLTPAAEQIDVAAVYEALRAAQGAQNEG